MDNDKRSSALGDFVKAAYLIARKNYIGAAWTLKKYIAIAAAIIILFLICFNKLMPYQWLFPTGGSPDENSPELTPDKNAKMLVEAAKKGQHRWAEVYSLALAKKNISGEKSFDVSGAYDAVISGNMKEYLANSSGGLNGDALLEYYESILMMIKEMYGAYVGRVYSYDEKYYSRKRESFRLIDGKIYPALSTEPFYSKKYVDDFIYSGDCAIVYEVPPPTGEYDPDRQPEYMYWDGKKWTHDSDDARLYNGRDTTIPVGYRFEWIYTGKGYVVKSGSRYWSSFGGWCSEIESARLYPQIDPGIPRLTDQEIANGIYSTQWLVIRPKLQIRTVEYGVKANFPVHGAEKFNYVDTFGGERINNGEKMGHEGIDIMAERNSRLVAIETCEINKIGWSGLGGWRILMTSLDGKRKYYYAHLENYSDWLQKYMYMSGRVYENPGIIVFAGEVLGYTGSSGSFYSNIGPGADTGTEPHLHLQIWQMDSVYLGTDELLINPFASLKLLQSDCKERLAEQEKLERVGLCPEVKWDSQGNRLTNKEDYNAKNLHIIFWDKITIE